MSLRARAGADEVLHPVQCPILYLTGGCQPSAELPRRIGWDQIVQFGTMYARTISIVKETGGCLVRKPTPAPYGHKLAVIGNCPVKPAVECEKKKAVT